MCEPVFSDSSLKDLTFAWDFGDKMSGERNSSTEEKPTHIFTNLGLYKVKLTINDSKSIKPIIIVKDVVVLTTPAYPDTNLHVGILEQNLGNNVRLRVDLINVWNNIDKSKVDVIVTVSGTDQADANGTYKNPTTNIEIKGDRRPKMWNKCASLNLDIVYQIKGRGDLQKRLNKPMTCRAGDFFD